MNPAPKTPGGPAGDPFANRLRPLLAGQSGRLRRRYLLHGLGLTALLPAAALVLFFALDHSLRLPMPVRLLHSAVVATLFGYGIVRFLRYPLGRHFAEVEIAQLLERTFPELHQRLVSAVQLQGLPDGDLRNQSRAMIDGLLDETAAAVQRLPLERLFDTPRTLRVLAGAGTLCAALTTGALLAPRTAQAFVLRHLGFAADYPRQTNLSLDLPPAGPELQRTDRDGISELVLPAGADLHVSVLAEGAVPKEVFLDVTPRRGGAAAAGDQPGARSVPMAARHVNRFRYVFRRLSGSFEFHARGGDDEHGDRVVIVRTVHPPQVATIRATVKPPPYTGIAQLVQTGGAIEALAGSEVDVAVTTTAAVRDTAMVFLESGRRLPMLPNGIQDDSGTSTEYRCSFVITASDRYQIDLVGEGGLRNPNPGTYPIAALQDYAPVGRWLLPDDEALLLLSTALLCVRLEARDDFGLRQVTFGVDRTGQTGIEKVLLPAAPPSEGAPPAALPTHAVLTELFEVADLLGAGPQSATAPGRPAGSDGLSLRVLLRDNREPEAGTVELPRRIVQIVEAPQLAEAIAKTFRGLREETSQALEVQVDRRERLEELRTLASATAAEQGQLLVGVEVGQNRVLGSCTRIHKSLMRAFDMHLWNRLEPSQHADQVVELYRSFSKDLQEPIGQDPAFYRDLLARRTAGTLGAMEKTLDPILAMVAIADQLVTTDGPKAARLLVQAQVARPGAELDATLQQILPVQEHIAQSLKQLLLRLEEWNDYQDLIQDIRAVRDRQRDLQNRTEDVRGIKDRPDAGKDKK